MGTTVSIAGVGGAGCNIVSGLCGRIQGGPPTIAINTDAEALEASAAPVRLLIGSDRTGGLGTGGDAAVGRICAEDERDKIRGVFSESDVAFVIAGLGGGTGSGATPVVLDEASKAGVLTLCFATLPASFEGKQRRAQADHALAAIRDRTDALIVLPNERLARTAGKSIIAEFFVGVNDMLVSSIASLWRMIATPGFIKLDFADLKVMIENSGGSCTLGHGEGRGRTRVDRALESLLSSPLLGNGEVVANSPAMLVSIVGGPDLAVSEVGQIMESIERAARTDCEIFMGTVVDDSCRGQIGITVVAPERWSAELRTEQGKKLVEPGTKTGATGVGAQPGKKGVQTKLALDAAARGRFRGIEPTVLNGEDIDTPAFIRRGIVVEK